MSKAKKDGVIDSSSEKSGSKRRQRTLGENLIRFFSSFGLAASVMFLLLVVTFLGTIGQVEHGLYDSQQKYFNSFFFVENIKGIPVPFPGGFLLLAVLFVNLLLGALIRVRKNWRGIGMVIAHSSILLLLAAGFVEFFFKRDGNMRLFEGQTSDEFQSYHKWVVEVEEIPADGKPVAREILVIPEADFRGLDEGKRTFFREELPFELTFSDYVRNSRVGSDSEGNAKVQQLALDDENERNLPALRVEIDAKDGAESPGGLLWGGTSAPFMVEADGREFALHMTRQTWTAPFALTLDKFTRALHPGTAKAKVFLSDVTKTESGEAEKLKITMNEPLRHEGYTFFQASWGPPEAKPGEPLYSVFAVVHNPSDQWPLYSCVLVGVGMLIHFLIKLFSHLRRQTRLASRDSGASVSSSSTKA